MKTAQSGAAVPRHSVFTMADGAFVIQWDEARVQDLLTGMYRPFRYEDIGHPVTDYELNQLKAAGRVEHFNRTYVWLYSLPETGRYSQLKVIQSKANRVRMYYLNTTLAPSSLSQAQAALDAAHLSNEYTPHIRGERVAIGSKDGMLFSTLESAENAQKKLLTAAPVIFDEIAVAFVEVSSRQAALLEHEFEPEAEQTDLVAIIASQTDTGATHGRRVVIVGGDEAEQQAIVALCTDLEMNVHRASSAGDALHVLEDAPPELLIMDMQLPDMHGWELLAKLREIGNRRQMRVIVLAAPSPTQNEQTLALGVAKVDVYLVKPVSMARLRQNIWMALKNQPPD